MGLAHPSQAVLDEILAKHPTSLLPTLPPNPTPPPIHISEEEVVKALRSFPNGSAPGPSGLRVNHLKEAVFCPSPYRAFRVLHSLSRLANTLCIYWECTFKCHSTFMWGNPSFVQQKEWRLMPNRSLRCLTPKCATRSVQHEAAAILTPLQLGVGILLGCKAIIHAFSSFTENKSIPSDKQYLIFLMPLTTSTVPPFFMKLGHILLALRHGWNCSYGA